MASVPGHESCASVVPAAAPVESRYNAKKIAQLQWLIHRMQLDADGVPGSYNELWRDRWYPYNARDSYNYADSYSMSVVSVSGSEITCQASGNPLDVLLYMWRERDSSGTAWVTGFERHGAPQAGDVIQFSASSKISLTCWPVITRIKSVAGNQITFETDKPMTAALSKRKIWDAVNGIWIDHPDPVTVRIWHHAGNPEAWRYIVPPDYFYGIRRVVTISEVPADGLVELAAVPVMHPGGFYPLEPTWTLEGRRIDNSEWESVPDADARLYAEGPSFVALKTTAPPDGVAAPGTDLTATYSAFRVSFWEKSDGSSPYCRVVGFARCKWSIPDPTGSNYGTGDGKAPGWVCLKRLVDHHDISGTTATHSSVPASGAARYPADGQCLKYNCCDQFAPAEVGDGVLTPFRYAYDAGVVIRDLLGACNQRLLRLVPRVASPSAWQAQRVKHPSLMWLVGHWGIDLPNVIDGQVARFRGYGLWGTGYYTYTDSLGNEYVDLVVGGMDGVKRSDNDGPVEDTDGHFVELGTAYTQKRNPVVPGATVIERELERFGVAVERGSGQLRSRGIAQSSVAVAAQDIIVPDIRKSEPTRQHRGLATFEFDDDDNGVIKIRPLRQESKLPQQLGTRRVASVSTLPGGRVRIELDNVEHVWSYIEDGPAVGDSYDRKISFWGGGGWPIMPLPSQSIDSHYEPNNYTGNRAHGAWTGDSISSWGRHFVIESVTAYGGSEAPNWGGVTYDKRGYRVGYLWTANEANLALGTDPETYGNLAISGVYNNATSAALTALGSPDRPTSIGAGEYWTDGSQIVVGAASAGITLRIEYQVALPTGGYKPSPYTEYVTVPVSVTVQTEILSSAWLGADEVNVEVDGAPATVDTSGTYVVLTVGHLQTGLPINITLINNTPAPAAEDWYSYDQNYTSYGRKRDVVIAYDDPDGFLATLLVGDNVEFWSAAAVMMPGATLEWTAQGADDWQPVTASVRHGDGEIVIPAGWWDDKPERLCFRVRNVELMDHRGIVPASVIDKLDLIARGMVWVKAWMGPSGGGAVSIWKSAGQYWVIDQDVITGCDILPPSAQPPTYDSGTTLEPWQRNRVIMAIGDTSGFPGSQIASNSLFVGVMSNSTMGAPWVLGSLPDGTEILQAHAQIATDSMVVTHSSGGDPLPVSYGIIGFTAPDDFEIIGTAPDAAEGTRVVDFTEIVQVMFAARGSGLYPFGYSAILIPSIMSSVEPPEGPPPTTTVYNPSYPCGSRTTFIGETVTVAWGGVAVLNVVIKVKYPDEEFSRTLLMPRLPVMA